MCKGKEDVGEVGRRGKGRWGGEGWERESDEAVGRGYGEGKEGKEVGEVWGG